MSHFFPRALRIQGRERRPFFWMLSFFILIFLFMAIFRTYVDAAFVEHSGPQRIPLMLLINGVITIAVFWFIGFLGKPPDCPLVAWFMIGSALLTGAMFGLVLRGSGLAYPILYQLLNLQDSFFLVYLWSIAGTLFDVRQGERLFPLLMAGQVLGTAVGSFLVAPLARLAGPDSPLAIAAVAYACVGAGLLITASAFVSRAGRRTALDDDTNKRPSEILSLIKKYPVIRYLTANAFYPSILLPVFTYQFFVIAHAAFGSQQALLTFLGVFRGATTLVTFVLLFAVGRFYAKVGLARAAFVHPLNFAVVFAGLAASFGIFFAAYGQFSVLFIQRAIAGPINKILFDAVPRRLIKWSRVFTGGTVVNGAVILSALAMVLLQKVLSAHDVQVIQPVDQRIETPGIRIAGKGARRLRPDPCVGVIEERERLLRIRGQLVCQLRSRAPSCRSPSRRTPGLPLRAGDIVRRGRLRLAALVVDGAIREDLSQPRGEPLPEAVGLVDPE